MLCLTHLHPDHIGLSWKILDLSGARLVMHRAEAEYLALVARESRAPFFEEAMRKSGVPDDLRSEDGSRAARHSAAFSRALAGLAAGRRRANSGSRRNA